MGETRARTDGRHTGPEGTSSQHQPQPASAISVVSRETLPAAVNPQDGDEVTKRVW